MSKNFQKKKYNEHNDLEINRRRNNRVDNKGKIYDCNKGKRELDLNFK